MEITNKSDVKAEKDAQKANLTPLLLQVINNPNKPRIAKDLAERKLYELNGLESDEAMVYAPPSYEELDALEKLELLNNNIMEGAVIDEPDVDHFVYLTIFDRALDTEAKFAAIQARKDMIIKL